MPELLVDIDTVGTNTEAVVRLLKDRGLELVAVTKGCSGEPRVAEAMLAAGAVALADSRDGNLRRLRTALPRAELHRIGLPSLVDDFEVGDVNYISSWANVEAVARLVEARRSAGGAGARAAARRRVMVLLETGDKREGVPVEGLMDLAGRIAADGRFELEGVATNYACLRGAPEGIRASVETVARAACDLRASGVGVARVSGGNSSVLALVARGERLPDELTELRCGEALLLGHDALYYETLPGCYEGGCRVRAEVVEEYTKQSAGGSVRHVVLAAGHQDIGTGGARFVEPGLEEIGRSADYLVAEAGGAIGKMPVGTKLEIIPDYEALATAWMSPHVDVRLV